MSYISSTLKQRRKKSIALRYIVIQAKVFLHPSKYIQAVYKYWFFFYKLKITLNYYYEYYQKSFILVSNDGDCNK